MFKSSVLARCISSGIRLLAVVPGPNLFSKSNLRIASALTKIVEPFSSQGLPQDIKYPSLKQAPGSFVLNALSENDTVHESLLLNELAESNTIHMDSVLRKRRLKMKKHKLRKRRRTQRALKKRLGKI